MFRNSFGQKWWHNLNIRGKLGYSYGLLLLMMILIAVISIITLVENRQETESVIVSSTRIQGLALEMGNHLETARRLELEFFFKYPLIGYQVAVETYIQPALNHIDNGISLSSQLETDLAGSAFRQNWQDSQVNLFLFLSTANRHAVIVDESLELVAQIADEETGLQMQLKDHTHKLAEIIQSANNPIFERTFLEMRIHEKDYFINQQRPKMQSAINKATDLSVLLDQDSTLNPSQKEQANQYLDEYLILVQAILQIDVEIQSKLNEFDLQTKVFEQVTAELVQLTNHEIQQARLEIFRSNTIAIFLLIATTGTSLIIAFIIFNQLDQNISQKIIALSQTAQALKTGHLEVSVPIESQDELGLLASSFNEMAIQIRTLVTGLEKEVKKQTQELVTERNRAQNYLDIAGVLILVLDENQKITLINKRGCVLLGGDEEEILGLNWFDHFIPSDQAEDVKSVYKQILSGEIDPVEYYENPIIRLDGQQRVFAWHNTTLEDENGKLIGILSSGEDISERHQTEIAQQEAYEQVVARQAAVLNLTEDLRHEIAERKLAQKEREQLVLDLEGKNQELETFVYTVSHDLKSPLVSLNGFTAMLKRHSQGKLDERGLHYVERLQVNVRHMEALINDLLELSRIGRVVGDSSPISMENLFENILGTLETSLKESGAEVSIETSLPTVQADHTRMGQVCSNILENAIKFRSPQRQLQIRVGHQETEHAFEFYVADNGIGIDRRHTKKIFLPFQKLDPGTDGMGIGLALVSRFIEYLGGRIWFRSEPGVGTTFYFTMPKTQQEGEK
jgi:PAS domain S-box-containing protein